jgi:predicted ribosome quality control (RQC) complex YloA/Tae2 family protein
MLMASPRLGAWLSEKVAEREETTGFTTELRRLLGRARFESAYQVGLDRIFVFELSAVRPMKLVLELMPPGNLIVTDPDGTILAIGEEVRSPRRRLVRGGAYVPPRQARTSPEDLRPADVAAAVRAEKTAGQAIGKHVSLPRKYVREILGRMALEESSPSSKLTGREDETVTVINALLAEARTSPSPCLAESDGAIEIFVVNPVAKVVKKAPTVSALCDEVLLPQLLQATDAGSEAADKQKEALEARVSKLRQEEESFRAQAAAARSFALSAQSAATVSDALRAIEALKIEVRKEPGSTQAVASLAYDRAKEFEVKADELQRAAKKLRAVAPVKVERASRRKQLPSRNREWFEKFRWFRTSEGKLAIGGRDAASNSILVRRHMEEGDTVYHANFFGSPFFILKGGKGQTDEEVREVAQATVAFSSAWKTGLGSGDAFWVRPEQVKSSAPSGEYLSRGSFLITGKKNLVPKNILEIAVGETDDGKVTAAPESAFKGRTRAYLVLRPQSEKSSETAKSVLQALSSMTGRLEGYTVDDILRVLPTGGGKVLRKYAAEASDG